MKCPKCGNKLLQKKGDLTKVRITGALTFDVDGRATAECFWCRASVELPLTLQKVDDAPDDGERFTIPRTKPVV